MTPSPETWITTETSPDGMAVRGLVFVAILLISFLFAAAFRDGLRDAARRVGPATRRAVGRNPDGGPWACAACRTVSGAGRRSCEGCGAPRATSELRFDPVETTPDIVPAEVPVDHEARVTLEHNAAAHADGLNGHWRLRVNGVVVGTAARRDGALALLRAVRGGSVVIFDPKGTGLAPYPLDALIRAFEGPRLPLAAPCPEAVRPPRGARAARPPRS